MTDFQKINVGDVVEGLPLMARLTPEKVVLMCSEKSEDKIKLDATYFGVRLGALVYEPKGGWAWHS